MSASADAPDRSRPEGVLRGVPSAAGGSRSPARRRPLVALGLALLAVYGPVALPFLVGPLTECDHCVRAYLGWLPVVPGAYTGLKVGFAAGDSDGPQAWAAMVATTMAALVVAGLLARRRGWLPGALLLGLAVLSGLQALGLSVLLRM